MSFRIEPDAVASRVRALIALADETSDLVASASRLAERTPALGTAPPARHLADLLKAAAGRSGLTGEVAVADAELRSFHEALSATLDAYRDGESDIHWVLRAVRDTES